MSQRSDYLLAIFYLTIFVEGYIVLSSELLAIRQLTPFVGSGTQTISIIVSAVLMPLSAGYYFGGKFIKKSCKIRQELIKNILVSAFILAIGLSYIFLNHFFYFLEKINITHHILQCTLFCILFLVYPTFLLGQTVSLISNYFRRLNISKATGIVLCISTLGSFFGSIFSVLVLMNLIGLNKVIIVNIALLVIIIVILNKKLISVSNIIALIIFIISVILNYKPTDDINILKNLEVKKANITQKYHKINPEIDYKRAKKLERRFINSLAGNKAARVEPKLILASGIDISEFAKRDSHNQFEFVDIDNNHQKQTKLRFKKRYIAKPINNYLKNVRYQYDLIFIDAYTHINHIKANIISTEFFYDVKNHLKEGGLFVFYIAAHPTFKDEFSKNLDLRIRDIFNIVQRDTANNFDYWSKDAQQGVIYLCYNKNYYPTNYTDNINTYYLDR